MKLLEFFGSPTNFKKSDSESDNSINKDELFDFILDHDLLYKHYFFPFALKVKELKTNGKLDRNKCLEELMPMVKKGCLEFYNSKKLTGKVAKLFPTDLREELCERLYSHYLENIEKNQYSLGD
jgi:hypothetical protein